MFDDPATCPPELLLFFHHLAWDWPGPAGDEPPLLDRIRDAHAAAVDEARGFADAWDGLEALIDEPRFRGVQARFRQQLNDAAVFSEVLVDYYTTLAQAPM